ncbi:MAG: Por secretion system C-terminal sorting protein [Bacteroidetes bacterium]|nr:Por secretion system C-terminal sorting protein [Bacteroidota bacterium]
MIKIYIFILFFFSLFVCSAQWTYNVSVNTTVTAAPKNQQHIHMVTDAFNGAIITWEDNRNSATNSTDIYAQRLNGSGITKWALNGIAVCTSTGTQKSSAITEAGNGAVIIAWEDNRSGNYDIYAQKIDSSGNILWPADGIIVCNKPTNQKAPKLVSDNTGGAIIVWEDSVNFYFDIYAQRISANGLPLWTNNGVAICTAPNVQNNPRIDFGTAGGAIITWQDKRNNSDYDIYAQSINVTGLTQWATDGVVICNAINTQSNPKIEPDGSNGAIIAWEDKRNALDYDIFAQRINSTGVTQWAGNGLSVVSTPSNQSAADMKYLGGNLVAFSWKDNRSGAYAVYAQLLTLSGNPQLATNGVQLSTGLKSINPNNISDQFGGVIISWQDSTSNGWNVSSQKINSSAIQQWNAGGIVISNAAEDQINITQIADGLGGAIFSWEDHRNTTDYDIFAQHVNSDGTTLTGIKDPTANTKLNAECYPNPINSYSKIRLNNNATNSDWFIIIHDTFGKTIWTKTLKADEFINVGHLDLSEGLYFYSITMKNNPGKTNGKFIKTASH